MRKKWKLKKSINKKIKGANLHPVIEQLFLNKNIETPQEIEEFLEPKYEKLHDPFLFEDMHRVVERVKRAIKNNEIIGIFGDHDADGVSSATILSEGLEKLGLNVDVYIPDKLTEGHGINKKAIDEFVETGVTLMFSVDCGTSNIKEVAYANEKNIDVIITDHHHAPDSLPEALAIINPQLKRCKYPFKELSGTAVAFKVVQALFEKLKPDESQQLKWLLDVVSVGTIADCMPLLGENRIFAKYGLLVLSKTRREGYRQMFKVSNINNCNISALTVAYQIAPRINAAGRMSHAKHAFELMRANDSIQAFECAEFIEEQNIERRKITQKLTREIDNIVKKDHLNKKMILIAGDYPLGIIGIVAGQIANKYKKPVGIFSKLENELRGSFRSIENLHIVKVLDKCSGYLERYGGHEQAAGAIIKKENFDVFCKKAQEKIVDLISGSECNECVFADFKISFSEIDMNFVEELEKFEPFGEQNEEPVFLIESIYVREIRTIGKNDAHLRLVFESDGKILSAIAFGKGKWSEKVSVGDKVDVLAHVQKNEWNGNVSVQLNVIDIR